MASVVSNAGDRKRELSALNPMIARGISPGSADDANWWMITLSDLTLLLLGFLVVWHATATKKPPAEQARPTIHSHGVKPPAGAFTMDNHDHSKEWSAVAADIETSIRKARMSEGASVEQRETDVIISLGDAVPFAPGKAELKPEARPVVEKVASLALAHPLFSIEVAGHTDDLPIANGLFPSNWELSAARASRVARYLIEKGVDAGRIAVEGYAAERPKAPNYNNRNRAANRRVEIRLYYAQSDRPAPTISPRGGD